MSSPPPLESKGYVALTLSILREYGVTAQETPQGWHIPGGQRYTPHNCQVEGGLVPGGLFPVHGGAVPPQGRRWPSRGWTRPPSRGTKACVELFRQFGLPVSWEGGVLTARNPRAREPFGGLRGITIDAAQIPDMVPALSVCAALSQGETRISTPSACA